MCKLHAPSMQGKSRRHAREFDIITREEMLLAFALSL